METYLESQRHNLSGSIILQTLKFNWFDELNKEEPNWEVLTRLAGSWITCACGNQCSIIPRDEDGIPKDRILREYGVYFSMYINQEDKVGAISVLSRIEKRSAKLI